MKKLFCITLRFLMFLLIIIMGVLVMFYLLAPVYKFSGPIPFSGDKLYNPYKNIDSTNWKKYNFQVQSKAWLGLTNGRKNSNQRIDSIYKILGFDHVATSDYQKINEHGKDKQSYIPTYEHGFNIFKTHQVCIGSEKVLWIDLMFGQTLSMKQWILDELSTSNRFVVIAHPTLRDGYSIEDMKYLTNYDAIEVLNNMRVSINHWDEALSSGQLAYIIGNDDAHDVLNSNDVGRRFTMINAFSTESELILTQLGKGAYYGMDFIRIDDEPMNDKVKRSKDIPKLNSAKLYGDTLFISVNKIAKQIRFISDNGEVVKTADSTSFSSCKMDDRNTYLRTEVEFYDDSKIMLNPIVRYSGDHPETKKTAVIDSKATLMLRIIYIIIGLTIVYGIFRIRKSRKLKRNR
ncbi:MAG: hypothetical protein P8I80_08335 [Bacteroidales bacterium]|nr:hypothetical protein [Bacteroidales bacterium]MDG2080186.1 hypothetical protein [Bacteroidales bacterium]